MSGQKYRRTNFEEDDDNQCMSPLDDATRVSSGRGEATTPSAIYDPWSAPGGGVGTPPSILYDPSVSFKTAAGMCHRRSSLERLLLILVAALALLALVLAIILGTHQHPADWPSATIQQPGSTNQPKVSQGLCTSKVCVTVASTMLNAMDDTVSPCDDFYQYACGGWIKAHPIPAGEPRWDSFGVVRQTNQIVLKNVLESSYNETGSEAEVKTRIYYQSCMDKNKVIETLGAKPLLHILVSDFGGWPLAHVKGANNTGRTDWDFQENLEKFHAMMMSNFFALWVDPDAKNPRVNILQIDQSGLALDREQYLNKTISTDPILSAYLKYMVDLTTLLGATDVNKTRAQLTDVIELEQALANISTPQEDRRDDEKMYHKMTIGQLQESAPFINWTRYINSRLSVTNATVNESEPLLVYEPGYMSQVSTLVTEKLQTPDGIQTITNYMMWHLVRMMSLFLSKPFQEVRKEWVKTVTGISGDQEQWRYCTADTDQSVFAMVLSAMFVRQTFHGESKVSAEKMVQGIKEAFISNLPKLAWMDDETRKAATEKARSVIDMIGYPDNLLNATDVDRKYDEMEVKEEEYFMNNYRAIRFGSKKSFEKLRQVPDLLAWSMVPSAVNAYYQPTRNEIVFPAGILQRPFYDKDYPRSLNYGAIGVVIGHELTHGFDDQGRQYDKDGYLRSWWNNSSVEKFKNQTMCMINEYSHYLSYGEPMKGRQTLGENIADNGGLKSSFNAYETWVDANGVEEALLPGMNFTHRQLFFLAFSQVWCASSRAEDSHIAIMSDVHSLPKYRVIGPLSNSAEFAQHYNCPLGSTMNPKEKCVVW